jgi:hypothetical protein
MSKAKPMFRLRRKEGRTGRWKRFWLGFRWRW